MIYISNGYESEPGRALASLFASAARQAHVTIFAVNAAGFGSVEDRRVDPAFWEAGPHGAASKPARPRRRDGRVHAPRLHGRRRRDVTPPRGASRATVIHRG